MARTDDDVFYLHEDEWGMIDLVPAENRAHSSRVVDEARRHGEEHRAPDGVGWTAMYLAPAPEVSLAERRLAIADLATLLGASWRRRGCVSSGYSTDREAIASAFAFTDGEHTLYGSLEDDAVTALHLDARSASRALADTLERVGRLQRLILVDLWRDAVVELADRAALDAYLAAE